MKGIFFLLYLILYINGAGQPGQDSNCRKAGIGQRYSTATTGFKDRTAGTELPGQDSARTGQWDRIDRTGQSEHDSKHSSTGKEELGREE